MKAAEQRKGARPGRPRKGDGLSTEGKVQRNFTLTTEVSNLLGEMSEGLGKGNSMLVENAIRFYYVKAYPVLRQAADRQRQEAGELAEYL